MVESSLIQECNFLLRGLVSSVGTANVSRSSISVLEHILQLAESIKVLRNASIADNVVGDSLRVLLAEFDTEILEFSSNNLLVLSYMSKSSFLMHLPSIIFRNSQDLDEMKVLNCLYRKTLALQYFPVLMFPYLRTFFMCASGVCAYLQDSLCYGSQSRVKLPETLPIFAQSNEDLIRVIYDSVSLLNTLKKDYKLDRFIPSYNVSLYQLLVKEFFGNDSVELVYSLPPLEIHMHESLEKAIVHFSTSQAYLAQQVCTACGLNEYLLKLGQLFLILESNSLDFTETLFTSRQDEILEIGRSWAEPFGICGLNVSVIPGSGFDVISFFVCPPSPISLIVSIAQIVEYHKLMHMILQLRYCLFLLKARYSYRKAQNNFIGQQSRMKCLFSLQLRVSTFLRTYETYLGILFEIEYKEMYKRNQIAKCLDDIKASHSLYVKHISEFSLHNDSCWQSIKAIFRIALDLCQLRQAYLDGDFQVEILQGLRMAFKKNCDSILLFLSGHKDPDHFTTLWLFLGFQY